MSDIEYGCGLHDKIMFADILKIVIISNELTSDYKSHKVL